MGSARTGSNPVVVGLFFSFFVLQKFNFIQIYSALP